MQSLIPEGLSELEAEAFALSHADRDSLIVDLLKMRIHLTAANEQIGALRWEVEHERRERRRLELTFCKGTR